MGKRETKKIRYNLLQSLNLQRSFQPFVAEVRVQFEAILVCELWWFRVALGRGFFRALRSSRVSYSAYASYLAV